MNQPRSSSARLARRVDQICRRFEHCWQSGLRPQIEDYLHEATDEERLPCLQELLSVELELLRLAGEMPDVEEYCRRFPQDEPQVRAAFTVSSGSMLGIESRSSNLIGQVLGDFQIVREIGRGGMGIVYEALQRSLDRRTAVKVLKPSWFHSERDIQRFHRESRTAARLHYSNIVEVYGVGFQEDIHYFAMRYVPGIGLDRLITTLRRLRSDPSASVSDEPVLPDDPGGNRADVEGPAPALKSNVVRELAASSGRVRSLAVAHIGEQIADALQYAHDRGVVHRDVKPSNLILDGQGTVWLTDFGLAGIDSESGHLTQSYDLIGTLRYMAPEAIGGRMDHRSDVYSLGLTLYELLTLKPALDESVRRNPLELIKGAEPAPPRQIDPSISMDMETVIQKAISQDQTQRYQSAGEVADDLRRFQRGEPIVARPVTPIERLGLWARRNRFLSSMVGIVAALLLIGITTTSLMWRQAARAAREFQDERARVVRLQRLSEKQEAHSNQLQHELLERSIRMAAARGADFRHRHGIFGAYAWTVEALRQYQRLDDLPAHGQSLHDEQIETSLRSRLGALESCLPAPVVRCWLPAILPDWYSGSEPVGRATTEWPAATVEVTDSDVFVNSALGQKWHVALDTGASRTCGHQIQTSDGRQTLSDADDRLRVTSPAEGRLIVNWNDRSIPDVELERITTTEQLNLWRCWLNDSGDRLAVQFSGVLLVRGGKTYPAYVTYLWNLQTGRLVKSEPLLTSFNPRLERSADRRRVIGSDNRDRIFELTDGTDLATIITPVKRRRRQLLVRSRNTRYVASSTDDGVVIQSIENPAEQIWPEPAADNSQVTCLTFPGTPDELWAGTNYGVIHRRSLSNAELPLVPWQVDSTAITAMAPDPSGHWIAWGNSLGDVGFLDPATDQTLDLKLPHHDAVSSIAWSPSADLMAVLTVQGSLTVWNLKTIGRGQVSYPLGSAPLTSVTFDPIQPRMLIGTVAGDLALCDATTGSILAPLPVCPGEILRTAWNPQGTLFAVACLQPPTSEDQKHSSIQVSTWLADQPLKPLAKSGPFAADRGSLVMPFFTPDGERLFVQSHYRADLLLPTQKRSSLRGPYEVDAIGWLRTAAVSANGRFLAAVPQCLQGVDYRISLFDLKNDGPATYLLLPRSSECSDLAFDASGHLIAAGQFGIRAWDLNSRQSIAPRSADWDVPAQRVVFSPSRARMLIVDPSNGCRLYSSRGAGRGLDLLNTVAVRLPTAGQPQSVAFTRDERRIAIVTATEILLFDGDRGELLMPAIRHGADLSHADMNVAGSLLAVAGDEGGLRRWTIPDPQQAELHELDAVSRRYTLASVDPDRGLLIPLTKPDLEELNSRIVPILQAEKPLDPQARLAWHASQANECRLRRRPVSEAFHLNRLLEQAPTPDWHSRWKTLHDGLEWPRIPSFPHRRESGG